jgi:NADH:ubiquinone oxidoreductase subunit E
MNTNHHDVDEILAGHVGAQRDRLIPILQEVQRVQGHLSREAMMKVGHHLHLPASKVFGVATFYNQFRFAPVGRFHIQVCRGTACHVKGSRAVVDCIRRTLKVEPGQSTRDSLFSLEVVACLGACGLAPVVAINGEFHGGVTSDSVQKLIGKCRRSVHGQT